MPDVIIHKVDQVWLKVECEKSILYEISDAFSFYAPNYKFNPKFKHKIWDGKIRLINLSSCKMYYGLHSSLKKFLEKSDYSVEYAAGFFNKSTISYDPKEIESANFEPRNYQIEAVKFALENKRCILLSPTGSGKSFIIYMIMKHIKKRTLIIVPTIGLVHQLASDFVGYNPKCANWIHKIMAGEDKDTKKPIVISTWQSLTKQTDSWFNQFDCIVGDEVHLFAATSLCGIMEKNHNTEWRIGTTGTISNVDAKVNSLTLEGLFGTIYKVSSTKELMDDNYLAKFKINILLLKHDKETSIKVRKMNYQEEVDFFVRNEKRNKFICNLALSQKKNTLILFQFVEKQGKVLYEMIKEKAGNKKIYFISGEIDGEIREKIRNSVNSSEDNIIIGSFGTVSTGLDIPNLHVIIFASTYKSKIKNLQSIGRGLRLNEGKDIAVLYDIVDDCSVKSKKNYSILHLLERIKIYNEEQFDFKIIDIPFNNK